MRNSTIARSSTAIPAQRSATARVAAGRLETIATLVEQARWLLADGAAGPDGERLNGIAGSPISSADSAAIITDPIDADTMFATLATSNTTGGGALAQLLNVIAAHVDVMRATR